MKMGGFLFLFLFVMHNIFYAGQTKIINKSFKAEQGKSIEFENFSGLNVKITQWDKNEIGINLKAYVDCSDKEYETNYIKSLDVSNDILGSRQIISLEKTTEESGTSIFGLFKVRLFYHFRSEIKGEIFLPKDWPANLNFTYSDIVLSGMKKLEEINGRGNDVKIYDCDGMKLIDNDYGKIKLEKCEGNLDINSRSTTIEINDHKGNLNIVSDYTDIKINNVDGKINIRDRSGDIEIKNAVVHELDIPYSDLEIRDMVPAYENNLKIKGKSSNYSFNKVKSNMEIESDYTEIRFREITGSIYFDGKSSKLTGNDLTGNLELKSHYSNFDFQNLAAKKIKVSQSNNSMNFYLITEPEQIDITNKYGNIDITMPRGYDGEINLGTRYGKIKSDFDIDLKSERSDMTGFTKGKNSRKKISIENYSGDILLKN